jgi:hypothetical protein
MSDRKALFQERDQVKRETEQMRSKLRETGARLDAVLIKLKARAALNVVAKPLTIKAVK